MIRKLFFVCIFFVAFIVFFSLSKVKVSGQDIPTRIENSIKKDHISDSVHPGEKDASMRPVLTIRPREMDFGAVHPGEGAKGIFTLKNLGSGNLHWSTDGPTGWILMERQKLTGVLEKENTADLIAHLSSLDIDLPGKKARKLSYPIQLSLEINNNRFFYRKDLPVGTYREMIKLTSNGGTRTLFFRFKVAQAEFEQGIQVDPVRIDFGVVEVGEQIPKRLQLKNRGREPLRWRVDIERNHNGETADSRKRGRYISFLNDEIKGKGVYVPSNYLKETLEISGGWTEDDGYPSGSKGSAIRYRFSGMGVALYFWKSPEGGRLNVYIDEKLMKEIDCNAEQPEPAEQSITDDLTDIPHIMTLADVSGRVIIEGLKLYGKEVKSGIPGWLNIFPDSGITTKEIEYINVTANSEKLNSGWYSDDIIIRSNGGDATIEVSLEVPADEVPKILDVYRYVKDNDYLYTTNPQAEAGRLQAAGYHKEGIAFRLFRSDTPGTISFYRWYNPRKRDHFYSYDMDGGGKSLQGYTLEGTIGNIATSRLNNTRELYRWYNSYSGRHFYTTDQNGEEHAKRGYRFDGIAGYVR